MEARKRERRVPARGAILAVCPECKGKGKVPRKLPFLANPRAPLTRVGRLGLETCSNCKGTGRVGVG